MNIVSISYKQAPLAVRNAFAFSEEDRIGFWGLLREVEQCVILSTCNRLEVYFDGKPEGCGGMARAICAYKGIPYSDVARYIRIYQGDRAVSHLIKVACGVDSMVLGEDEILRQLKEAYAAAQGAGMTGYEFNTVFQMALQAAKEIKTRTGISETPVSVGTLAANEVCALEVERKQVLVIGVTGKIGGIVARNLLCKRDVEVTGTFRSHAAARPSDEEGGWWLDSAGLGMRRIPFSERYEAMRQADAIVSATASPHFTVTKKEFLQSVPEQKERLFIDLAVPNDIDEEIGGLPGCRLINIDYFDRLAAENNRRRREKARTAEKNADEWAEEIAMELRLHGLIGRIPELESALARDGVGKLIYSLRRYADRSGVDAVADWLEAYLDPR